MGAKLKAQASATVRELVDTNAVERGVATTTTRADDAMDADPRARELTELTELLQGGQEPVQPVGHIATVSQCFYFFARSGRIRAEEGKTGRGGD